MMNSYDLEAISTYLIDNIEDVLSEFDIIFRVYDNRIQCACPIHGGDNPNGFSILLSDIGNWQCFTQGCHEQYDSSIIGFIEAILNVQYSRKVGRSEAIEWAARFANIKPNETNIEDKTKTKFINLYKYISKDKSCHNNFVPRTLVRKSLQIPAQYYLDRYSQAILIEYDVGFCNSPDKSMYNRVVVPLYDETGEYMLGCIGRSIFPHCDNCKWWHHPDQRCPLSTKEKIDTVKWKFSSKFNADNYLYNLWKALPHIKQTKFAILVEGPGDLWRLEEAGIHNGLALLGTKFTDSQCEILESIGVLDVVIATDNGEAGEKARNRIEHRVLRLFNVHHLFPTQDDIGDMSTIEVKEVFSELIDKLNSKFVGVH